MNDEQRTQKTTLIWFILIFQIVTLAFLISTRLIDADMRQQYRNSVARYDKQAEQYKQQTERYTKTLGEYEKQKSQYDAQSKLYEKNMEEYKSNLKERKEIIPIQASEAIGTNAFQSQCPR